MTMTVKIKAKIILAAILALSIILMTACGGGSTQYASVAVSGSTSVLPYVEVLAEEFVLRYSGNAVDVQGGGSSAGIMAVESDIADIGMSSRPLRDDEQHLWVIEIAKDGLAMIIHPQNMVYDLTLEQVRKIYTGQIERWSELGGMDAKIHIVAREEGSGTRGAFEELVMDGHRITPKALVQPTNGAMRQLVSGDPNAIGFISLGLVNENVKAVNLDGVAPTAENVTNDVYSLFRPFLLVASEKPEGATAQFINFILSPEGKEHMIKEGLVPSARGSIDEKV
jgi:phosphate transport system substrate-binding protein